MNEQDEESDRQKLLTAAVGVMAFGSYNGHLGRQVFQKMYIALTPRSEEVNAGDLSDAMIRYAQGWREEGGEVFGPALMIDAANMIRELNEKLNRMTEAH